MTPTPDPHWTAYLKALLTPLVAIIAAYVAWRNVETARNKLKLDLFYRRLKAYDHIQDVISDALKDRVAQHCGIPIFVAGVKEGRR